MLPNTHRDLFTPTPTGLWVVENLILDHVGLPHVIDCSTTWSRWGFGHLLGIWGIHLNHLKFLYGFTKKKLWGGVGGPLHFSVSPSPLELGLGSGDSGLGLDNN